MIQKLCKSTEALLTTIKIITVFLLSCFEMKMYVCKVNIRIVHLSNTITTSNIYFSSNRSKKIVKKDSFHQKIWSFKVYV